MFHLDDGVIKDYFKGKHERLMLEDRYKRKKKKGNAKKTECMVFVYASYDQKIDRIWIIIRVGVVVVVVVATLFMCKTSFKLRHLLID